MVPEGRRGRQEEERGAISPSPAGWPPGWSPLVERLPSGGADTMD